MFSIIVFFGVLNLVATIFQTSKPLMMLLTNWMHLLILPRNLSRTTFLIFLTENLIDLWTALAIVYLSYAF